MIGWRNGLGYTYDDLQAAFGGREDCSPWQSDCVNRQAQRGAAVLALFLSDPKSGHNTTEYWPAPKVSWAPDTSDAALQQYLNNQPVLTGQVSYAGAPVQSVAQLQATPSLPAAGKKAVVPETEDEGTLFDLKILGFPAWAWAGGAAVLLFGLGGGRGR